MKLRAPSAISKNIISNNITRQWVQLTSAYVILTTHLSLRLKGGIIGDSRLPLCVPRLELWKMLRH